MAKKCRSATSLGSTSRKIWAESRQSRTGWQKSDHNAGCTARGRRHTPMSTKLAYKEGRPYFSRLTGRYYPTYDAAFQDSAREGGGADIDFNLYFVRSDGASEIVF